MRTLARSCYFYVLDLIPMERVHVVTHSCKSAIFFAENHGSSDSGTDLGRFRHYCILLE